MIRQLWLVATIDVMTVFLDNQFPLTGYDEPAGRMKNYDDGKTKVSLQYADICKKKQFRKLGRVAQKCVVWLLPMWNGVSGEGHIQLDRTGWKECR